MPIQFTYLNGKHPDIDCQKFEESFKRSVAYTCQDASIFLLNNFPILPTPQSTIDLLLIIVIRKGDGNYVRLTREGKNVYLYNQIIPIKIVSNLQGSTITEIDEGLLVDNDVFDYVNDVSSLRYGSLDYLSNRCGFTKSELFVTPMVFIKSKGRIAASNCLVSEKFDFEALILFLQNCGQNFLCSYKTWMQAAHYLIIDKQIGGILDRAAEDSKSGYLTKRKIERISKSLSEEKEIYVQIGKNLSIISGKAGTGKSSELLAVKMHCINEGRNTLYLTYNKLLVNDISRTIKSYINSKGSGGSDAKGEHAVMTLHQFFFKISRSVGVLHLLSEKRIAELLTTLKQRTSKVLNALEDWMNKTSLTSVGYANSISAKEYLQNLPSMDKGTKEVGIDFVNFLRKFTITSKDELINRIEEFKSVKIKQLGSMEADKIFLSDYYNVLKETLLAINDPETYFSKYDVQDKYELLDAPVGLTDKHLDEENKIGEQQFLSTLKRKIGGNKRRRTLFVDEAQDCFHNEREILFSIFGHKNLVVASGGTDQLIRHTDLCNWEVFRNKKLTVRPPARRRKKDLPSDTSQTSLLQEDIFKIEAIEVDPGNLAYDVIRYDMGRQSYRVKRNILRFCNFVAESCGLNLNLLEMESEDSGELIFDFRSAKSSDNIKEELEGFVRLGQIAGCTPYESLIVLIDSEEKVVKNSSSPPDSASVNEHDNIERSSLRNKSEWRHKKALEGNMMFWDGATDDKGNLPYPSPNECRLLFYHSCRGLEAWSVACFNIDRFYNQKKDDPDAEKYLLEDEMESGMHKAFLTNEERKQRFAGTWVLMALTRAIDTLYLDFNQKNSELSLIAMEYIKQHPDDVRVFL